MQVIDRVNGMHLKRYHTADEETPPSGSVADEQPPMTVCSGDEEPHPTDPDPSDAGSFPDDDFSDDSVPPLPPPMPPPPDTDKTTSGMLHFLPQIAVSCNV